MLTKLKNIIKQSLDRGTKPKVLFADSVAASHTSILVGDLAKLLHQNGVKDMGQNDCLIGYVKTHI